MLYEKLRGAKREQSVISPHQGRWRALGTAIGDVIQRDILFAEKHYAKATGQRPRFTFERNVDGMPMFEGFAKKAHRITHNGRTFAIYGAPDGIMRYVTDDGEILRVGLEVKSKQTSSAKTSEFSQRNGPESSHVAQTICYSAMYDVDFYVILYVNASKKTWEMDAEEYAKNPDIALHGVYITDEDRAAIFEHFTDVLHAAEIGNPPTLDIGSWTFNSFKRACALSLSDAEVADLQRQVTALQRSSLPDYKKRQPAEALADILRIRAERTEVGA